MIIIGNYQKILNNIYSDEYKTNIYYLRYKEYLNYCRYNSYIPMDINVYIKQNIDNHLKDLFMKKFNKDFSCSHKII